MTTPTTQ